MRKIPVVGGINGVAMIAYQMELSTPEPVNGMPMVASPVFFFFPVFIVMLAVAM